MAKLYLPCLIVYKGHFIYKGIPKTLIQSTQEPIRGQCTRLPRQYTLFV